MASLRACSERRPFSRALGIEVRFAADLRHAEDDGADAAGEGFGFVTVGVPFAGVGALVGLGLEDLMAFDAHGLVDEETQAFGEAVVALLLRTFFRSYFWPNVKRSIMLSELASGNACGPDVRVGLNIIDERTRADVAFGNECKTCSCSTPSASTSPMVCFSSHRGQSSRVRAVARPPWLRRSLRQRLFASPAISGAQVAVQGNRFVRAVDLASGFRGVRLLSISESTYMSAYK